MLDRTTLDGQSIGTVVDSLTTRTDSAIETLNFLAAKNAGGTGVILNVNSVLVDGGRTLAQWVSSLAATSSDGSRRVDSDAGTRGRLLRREEVGRAFRGGNGSGCGVQGDLRKWHLAALSIRYIVQER